MIGLLDMQRAVVCSSGGGPNLWLPTAPRLLRLWQVLGQELEVQVIVVGHKAPVPQCAQQRAPRHLTGAALFWGLGLGGLGGEAFGRSLALGSLGGSQRVQTICWKGSCCSNVLNHPHREGGYGNWLREHAFPQPGGKTTIYRSRPGFRKHSPLIRGSRTLREVQAIWG